MSDNNNLVFGSKNYKLMILGIALLVVGFIIMSMDKEEYGFGFLGLVLGPIVVMLGFTVEFFAIFAKKNVKE
jgi:hypothetical protein